MSSDIEIRTLEKLVGAIAEIRSGLDPEVLASWYQAVEADAKNISPDELRESITVIRDPIITLKFEFKASRRVVPYVIQAIDRNLPLMPFATALYFQKLKEMMELEEFRQRYK